MPHPSFAVLRKRVGTLNLFRAQSITAALKRFATPKALRHPKAAIHGVFPQPVQSCRPVPDE